MGIWPPNRPNSCQVPVPCRMTGTEVRRLPLTTPIKPRTECSHPAKPHRATESAAPDPNRNKSRTAMRHRLLGAIDTRRAAEMPVLVAAAESNGHPAGERLATSNAAS